jgi:PRC-barrel domain protein
MIRTLTLATILAATIGLPAIAEDVKSQTTMQKAVSTQTAAGLSLTSQEAEAWIGKPVYSSDGKKLGEVAAFQRAADNKVTEMQADIGGFLGFGEHRIRLMPGQIDLQSDRIVLGLTAAQAKELPKLAS